jgi:hypothetical protein
MNIKRIAASVRGRLSDMPRGAKWLAAAAGALVFLWPRKTTKLDYINTATRDRWYGPIQFIPYPVAGNKEGIRITNDFEARNIVREDFPLIGRAGVHRLAAPSLHAALEEIARRGWGYKIRSFAGGFYPRFVRNSTTNLSSHSYGTSIDINADENPQGSPPTQDQLDIAPIFERHGWYFGDKFKPTRDPMHFEFVLPPAGVA